MYNFTNSCQTFNQLNCTNFSYNMYFHKISVKLKQGASTIIAKILAFKSF